MRDDVYLSEFPVTRWSMVLKLRGSDDARAGEAMDYLCRRYWYPLYVYARRKNLGAQDAEDATQAFFARLISGGSLDAAEREKGRLRSFLLGAMKNFLNQRWRNENTQKRGREMQIVSIDSEWAEERFTAESSGHPAELAYDLSWATALLDRAMQRLEEFYKQRERLPVFEALKGSLTGDGDYGSQAALAADLGMSEEGVRSAAFQLRQRFRRYLEEEVLATVGDEAEMREEFTHLCQILAQL